MWTNSIILNYIIVVLSILLLEEFHDLMLVVVASEYAGVRVNSSVVLEMCFHLVSFVRSKTPIRKLKITQTLPSCHNPPFVCSTFGDNDKQVWLKKL